MKISNSRSVLALAISCTDCGAFPGEGCRRANRTKMVTAHKRRRESALSVQILRTPNPFFSKTYHGVLFQLTGSDWPDCLELVVTGTINDKEVKMEIVMSADNLHDLAALIQRARLFVQPRGSLGQVLP